MLFPFSDSEDRRRLSFFVSPPLTFSVSIASALLTKRAQSIRSDAPYKAKQIGEVAIEERGKLSETVNPQPMIRVDMGLVFQFGVPASFSFFVSVGLQCSYVCVDPWDVHGLECCVSTVVMVALAIALLHRKKKIQIVQSEERPF